MPHWPVPRSFRAQIAVVSLASLAVIALAGLVIRDVIRQTESRLLAEARRQVESACRELVRQHQERAAWGGDSLESLPPEAQDLSLRGLTATVLRSYEGLEGGFYLEGPRRLLGHAAASGTVPAPASRELELLASAAAQARAAPAASIGAWGRDLIVVVAARLEQEGRVAWVLKRLRGTGDPVARRRQLWYGALALSATLGMATLVWLWLALHRGVARIKMGLARLEQDIAYRLPGIPGEFGQIARAVNRMAERRMVLEAELRRQDRLAALGKVVAGVAHEIRNPLNSIRLTLEMLARRLSKGAATGEEVQAAMREIDRLDGILARLLAFGRSLPVECHPQDLAPLLGQAIEMVREPARQKAVRITLDKDLDELRAEVDGPQIVQVFINLLLNAIEASPPEGTVQVKARSADSGVVVSVSDHGPGIPEAVRPHIFEAFFTTRPEGTGLGLSISRDIIAAHGGSLELDASTPNTTFRVWLPGPGGKA